jgi:hypothetical protein
MKECIRDHAHMSLPVDLSALRSRVEEYGPGAFLVTVSEDGSPHVVSVAVACDDELLTTHVGRRTATNLAARPRCTLLWPGAPNGDYSLIVDADAVNAPDPSGALAARATAAILHRVALATGDGPTCIAVDGS